MNKIDSPKTNNTQGKTWRCLQVLLKGKVVNRKTLGDLGIAVNNDSAHSLISTICNRWFVPVERRESSDRTCDYYMDPEEIDRYQDPFLRQKQREKMRDYVFGRRRKYLSQQLERASALLSKRNTSSNDH